MAYNYEYPYTDSGRYNDDWLLNKVKELEAKIVGIEDDIFKRSKEYIDEQLVPYIAEVQSIRAELGAFEEQINRQFDSFSATIGSRQVTFEQLIEARIDILEGRIDAFREQLNASITAVNARTDLAIQQNNEYIFEVLSEDVLGALRVTNYFTGERVTVQEMLNYLAQLHVDDGLTYAELAARNKTYTQLAALGINYTNLVLHGGSLIN